MVVLRTPSDLLGCPTGSLNSSEVDVVMNRRSITVSRLISCILGLVLGSPAVLFAAEIKKCQDEQGNWHYGNFADAACANTEITKLSDSGTEIGREAPPLTREELDRRQAKEKEKEEEKNRRNRQRIQDQNIVQIYGSEETIISTRDRKLESIDNNLEVTRQLKAGILSDLEELRKRAQSNKVKELIEEREQAIQSYDEVIQQSLVEREKLTAKYSEILQQFRESANRLAADS